MQRLSHRVARQRVLCALSALIFVQLLACTSDEAKKRASASPACAPTCSDDACGDDDGCGGTCGCPSGFACDKGVCEANDCGGCATNETCVGGACVCAPNCADEANRCRDDGCGGLCPCPEGYVQNKHGMFVPPDQCKDTCASAGWVCGSLCGQDCGACGDGSLCKLGQCECQPVCDGTRCDDGCGGSCECAAGTTCNAAGACVAPEACNDTCASTSRSCGAVCGASCGSCEQGESCVRGACSEAVSCADCALRMYLVEREVVAGRLKKVVLAIDYLPTNAARPRVADLRIKPSRSARLVRLEAGEAITNAGKQLYVDDVTGNPWGVLPDGSYQMLILRATSTQAISSGRLVLATFELDELGPAEFSIVRREQMFAPLDADAALQASGYDRAVVVTP